MAKQNSVVSKVIDGEGPHPDGRRERSRSSRGRIVRAMMDLIVEGDIDPSAAKVAEKAGVGLRSVFRHFDDKESIYSEMNTILWEAYSPKLNYPFESDDWREQLLELIERRAKVWEKTAPFRLSTSLQRFRSPTLMENYQHLLAAERKARDNILPEQVKNDSNRERAILLATSFDTWRLFRHDEGLSNKKTIEVMQQLLRDIFDQIED